mgnify:CR=1 FL=1
MAMQSRYFAVQEVVPGVYAALAVPGQGAWSNAGFVDLGKGILVFDTMFTPGAGRDLRAVAEAVTGKPVRWVVNSHRDYDHYLGNQAFSDVDIISTRKTREVMAQRTPAFIDLVRTQHASFLQKFRGRIASETDPLRRAELTQEYDEHAALAAARDELVPVYPSLLFDRTLILHGEARRAELHCFGHMHTESDVVLYLPEDRVLFTGDVVQVGYHPVLRCGVPAEWVAFMSEVLALHVRWVVPGHGPVGSRDDLELMNRYVREIREWAAGSKPVPEPFRRWKAGEVLEFNLEYLRQLEG